jgi:hypothetical protein
VPLIGSFSRTYSRNHSLTQPLLHSPHSLTSPTHLTHTHPPTHPLTRSPCEVPLLGFVGALLAWRVLALCWAVHRRGRAAARTLVHARDPLAAPTQLTQLLAEEPTEGDG